MSADGRPGLESAARAARGGAGGPAFRADCHVHLGPIGGPHTEAPPSPAELEDYATSEGLTWIFGIYASDERLEAFRRAMSARIVGFFWARHPDRETLPASAEGLKLHPYLDGYTLDPAHVAPALRSAADRGLPVLIHTDDRTPEVSRAAMVGALAVAYPATRFVIAHAGAYAPPASSPFRVREGLVRELVGEAIAVCGSHENVWLESSVLASEAKTTLLAEGADPARLLFGSDYPILKESHGSVRRQEATLMAHGWSEAKIRRVHRNARELLG